ncbi:cytochrome c-type biogenesis protein CcmH [Anaerolineales bacterium HSG6]|nr:cytochrome c-type biogenesis protein CcmH [Anaerolineales bacterium HSG6]MDM8531172.1 cytochrome c-type biogenesis protein CcmH [Anaerolineales bacterium HSG25]
MNRKKQTIIHYPLSTIHYSLFTILFLVLAITFLFPTLLLAQEGPTLDEINEVAQELNCPTCSGLSLSDCPTITCQQWKDQIKDLLVEGYTPQEVLDHFSIQYGQQVLQEPPTSGITLWLWALPVVTLIIGGGWLFYTMRRWQTIAPKSATSEVNDTSATTTDDYLGQVEQDLIN